jgi:hypothetical protein
MNSHIVTSSNYTTCKFSGILRAPKRKGHNAHHTSTCCSTTSKRAIDHSQCNMLQETTLRLTFEERIRWSRGSSGARCHATRCKVLVKVRHAASSSSSRLPERWYRKLAHPLVADKSHPRSDLIGKVVQGVVRSMRTSSVTWSSAYEAAAALRLPQDLADCLRHVGRRTDGQGG